MGSFSIKYKILSYKHFAISILAMYAKFCTCEKLVVEYLELGKYVSSLTMEFDSIVSACGSGLCCRPLEMIIITKQYAVVANMEP